MLTKNQIKFIQSLGRKKNRDKENCFVVEGHRAVDDFLAFCKAKLIAGTPNFFAQRQLPAHLPCYEIDHPQLHTLSTQKTPQDVIAVFEKPHFPLPPVLHELVIALDCIQDPGNLGTIIRTADWMGIRHIICSPDTVDVFSPKVVQSTMGALARVAVHQTPLVPYLAQQQLPILGTFLEGASIYASSLPDAAIVVMGNEGNGISPEVAQMVTQKIHIPTFAPHGNCVESLNVGIAAAIVCAEIRRQNQR